MHSTTFLLGTAIPLAALPSAAQERGAIDFGAFVSYNAFASTYDMRSAAGYGARVGVHVGPRVAVEIEANGGTATHPIALTDRPFRGTAQHGSLMAGVSLRKP